MQARRYNTLREAHAIRHCRSADKLKTRLYNYSTIEYSSARSWYTQADVQSVSYRQIRAKGSF